MTNGGVRGFMLLVSAYFFDILLVVSIFQIFVFISASVGLIFSGLVYFNSKKTPVVLSYCCISLFASMWSFATVLISVDGFLLKFPFPLFSLHYFFGGLAYLSFVSFSIFYPFKKIIFPRWFFFFAAANVFSLALIPFQGLFFENIMASAENLPKITFAFGYAIYALSIAFIFFLALAGLISKQRQSSSAERPQIFFLIVAHLTAGSVGFFSNILLPVFGRYDFFFISPILVMFALIGLGLYDLLKYNLFNLKILLAELLVIAMWVAILVRIFFSNSGREILGESLFLLASLIIGVFLIWSVKKEVSQREQAEKLSQELLTTNEHLREMDRMKSEFVLLASHQLRAPLTAIKGYASMFREGSFGALSKEMVTPMDRIVQSAENLVGVIDGFLNLSRIERGELSYEFATEDIAKLSGEICKEFLPRAQEKNLKLSFSKETPKEAGEKYLATVDKSKIRQIISNLIDNSIKYTPAGEVRVCLSHSSLPLSPATEAKSEARTETKRNAGKILLCVSDTGTGIPPEDMPHLFRRFSRGSKEGARKLYTEGTGLGLYVAKEMMEAHHGRIWAESEGRGKGSKFCIELQTNYTPPKIPEVKEAV